MKRTIRLTENELRGMISEAVANTLNESTSDYLNGRLPNTDEDFCTLIFGRTFEAVGQISELLSELDQQMSQPLKKRFSQIIKELQKSYNSIEKARLLNGRIRNEIRFGSKESYHGGGEYERRMESNFGNI